MGRNLLLTKHPLPRNIITTNLKFIWGNIWDKTCKCKEGAFIWFIWHKDTSTTSWRARFINDIDDKYFMCIVDTP